MLSHEQMIIAFSAKYNMDRFVQELKTTELSTEVRCDRKGMFIYVTPVNTKKGTPSKKAIKALEEMARKHAGST